MKIKDGYMLRSIAGSWVVVPIGQRVVEFNGLISLNETGALLWKVLQSGADTDALVASMLSEYDIDEATAKSDVQEFIDAVHQRELFEQ